MAGLFSLPAFFVYGSTALDAGELAGITGLGAAGLAGLGIGAAGAIGGGQFSGPGGAASVYNGGWNYVTAPQGPNGWANMPTVDNNAATLGQTNPGLTGAYDGSGTTLLPQEVVGAGGAAAAGGAALTGGAAAGAGSTLGATAGLIGGGAALGGALAAAAGGSGGAAPVAPGGGTASTGPTTGQVIQGVGAAGSLLGGVGSIAKGLTSGSGTNTSAPNPATIAGGILQDEINFAPQVYNTTQQYAPQYAGLQSGLLQQSASSVLGGYSSQAPALQGIQTALNSQQAGGNLGLLGQYGSAFVQQYLAANPQLAQTQNSLNNLANNPQNPVGQIGGAGNLLGGAGQQAINAVNGNQVGQAFNPTLAQLNNTAQQQLALGTSISPQEQQTVANQVLSTYNSMGRANDPTAIAGLATGLDTYGQQLLAQREGAASTAAGQLTQAQTANQAAQAANLSAQTTAQGQNISALGSQGQQQLQGGALNQQAQLSNAQYQQSLLQSAAALEQSSAAPAYQALFQQSQGLSNAYNTTAQGGTSLSNANALSGMYNPFNSAAYGPAYGAAANANINNANTNAGLIGGGLSLLGNLAGSSGFTNALAGLFG